MTDSGLDKSPDWAMPRIGSIDDYPKELPEWGETGELPPEHQWLADAAAQVGHEANHVAGRPEAVRAILFAARTILVEHPEQRDFDYELRVARMLYWTLANGVDEHGNGFMHHWLRSNEVYDRPPIDGVLERSDTVGMRTYSWLGFGRSMGYSGTELEEEWFVSYRASGVSCDMPLRGISEVVDDQKVMGKRQGDLREGPTPRGNEASPGREHFHAWIWKGKEQNPPKPFIPKNGAQTVQPAIPRRPRLFRRWHRG